jgi:GNAT superfamily N-acetyltransferase
MSRTLVTLREAQLTDALFLVGLWKDSVRAADTREQLADLEMIIKTASQSPEQRLLVAEYDGEPVGAVFLRATTFGPLNLEPVVQVLSPYVVPSFRRKGVGHALIDAGVSFAEELGIGHVATAAASTSRDGNRFLARLGLASQAVFRIGPTAGVRAKLTASLPASQRPRAGRGNLGQVLAARRSMRRSQTTA